jgi:hypothetical protein
VSADCAFRHVAILWSTSRFALPVRRVNPHSKRACHDRRATCRGAPGAVFLTQAGLSRRENVAQTPGADIDCLVTVEKALGDDRFMGSKNLTR